MLTWASTRELYELFLESAWWRELSRSKRWNVGQCERCHGGIKLQSHHKVYRENWFDTVEEDLEVLCRDCHEKEHGLGQYAPQVKVEVKVTFVASPASTPEQYRTLKELRAARSELKISRVEFRRQAALFKMRRRDKRVKPAQKVDKRGWCRRKSKGLTLEQRRKAQERLSRLQPVSMNTRPHYHWVNRGTSSN